MVLVSRSGLVEEDAVTMVFTCPLLSWCTISSIYLYQLSGIILGSFERIVDIMRSLKVSKHQQRSSPCFDVVWSRLFDWIRMECWFRCCCFLPLPTVLMMTSAGLQLTYSMAQQPLEELSPPSNEGFFIWLNFSYTYFLLEAEWCVISPSPHEPTRLD